MPRILEQQSCIVIFANFEPKMAPSTQNLILKGVFEVKFIDMAHRVPAVRKNVVRSLHRLPQNDFFETWTIKIS